MPRFIAAGWSFLVFLLLPSLKLPGGLKISLPVRLKPVPVVSRQIVETAVRILLILLPLRLNLIVVPLEVLPLYDTDLASAAEPPASRQASTIPVSPFFKASPCAGYASQSPG